MAEVLEPQVKAPSEPAFSKKNVKLLTDPLDGNNPVTVQVLGICSALAVTVQLEPALYMAAGVTFVTAFSNLFISMLKDTIPARIRIIVQLAIVSLWVILLDQLFKAYAFEVSKKLSVFVGLIITNCIVMGRLEAYAMANKPWPSFLDGIGNGLGYGVILVCVAFVRELFGSGSLFGFKIIDATMTSIRSAFGPVKIFNFNIIEAGPFVYQGNGLMMLPAGACIVVGILIWIQRARNGYSEEA